MKKTLYVLLFIFSLFALAGCQEEAKEDKNAFTLELIDLTGQKLVNEQIEFVDGGSKTALELIEAVVEIDYDTFDFGIMINGLAGHYPKEYGASYNYFYEIQVNGEASNVGLAQIEYEKDMVISFVETSTLSTFDQSVDDFIYSFIENNLANFLSDDRVDYMVAAALHQMNKGSYTDLKFENHFTFDHLDLAQADLSEMSIGEMLKAGVVFTVSGKDLTTYKSEVAKLSTSNPYGATSYLESLLIAGLTDEVIAAALMGENINDPDLAGMALVALAPYKALEGFDTFLGTTTDYLKTTLSTTGIKSWGAANAASTAQAILGLVAQGINPQDEAYQTEGIGLVEALMLYNLDGGFTWKIGDAKVDNNFSTPQAFAALVAYKLSRDVWGFPGHNIFDF